MSAKLLALDREMQSSSSDELQVVLCSDLQHSGLAEQSRGIVGSSGTSTSVSSVMSLMTKEVVEWNEDPKQGKGEETFELPEDKKSGVNEAAAASAATILAIWLHRWLSSSCSSVVRLRAGRAGFFRARSLSSDPRRLGTEAFRCMTIRGLGFQVCLRGRVSLLTRAYVSSSSAAIQAMSARVGTGGTSFKHRSEMLGRVSKDARGQGFRGRLVPILLTTLRAAPCGLFCQIGIVTLASIPDVSASSCTQRTRHPQGRLEV